MKEELKSYFETERQNLRRIREINIFGDIDEDTAKEICEDIDIMISKNIDPISIHISSPGGNAFYGLAIIQAIRRARDKGINIIGEVYGHSMSMAFFILQCCNKRIMGKYCKLMAHGITTFMVGSDMKDVEAERKIMLEFREDFAELIASRCTSEDEIYRTPGFWYEVLENNTPQFYNSKESLEMGLIDEIK